MTAGQVILFIGLLINAAVVLYMTRVVISWKVTVLERAKEQGREEGRLEILNNLAGRCSKKK